MSNPDVFMGMWSKSKLCQAGQSLAKSLRFDPGGDVSLLAGEAHKRLLRGVLRKEPAARPSDSDYQWHPVTQAYFDLRTLTWNFFEPFGLCLWRV